MFCKDKKFLAFFEIQYCLFFI